MQSAKYLVLSVSVIALASCTSAPITDKNLPTPEISTNWSAAEQGKTLTGSAVQNGWLDDLKMEQLSSFIDEVLSNNPNFIATARRMEAAGYTAKVSEGGLYPTLNASLGARRQKSGSTTSNSLSVGLDARWEIDVWDRLSAVSGASDANYMVAKYNLAATRLSLAAQVAQAWFDVMEANAQYRLAKETVKSYEQAFRVVQGRYSRGLSTGLDLRLIQTNLEASYASLNNRENQLGTSKRRLEILAGKYPAAQMNASGELPNLDTEIPVGVPMSLLERRPDILSAKAKLLAAGYNSQAADKELLPSLAITASGSNSSSNFSDLLKFDNIFWNLVGNITQPIFQGGKLRYRAKSQEALFEAEKQTFATTLLNSFKEVEDALASERALKEQVKHREKAAENAVAAANVALDQYGRGLIKISVLLESQRQSLAQQSQLISIKKQRINNRISLHLALGGDFTTKEDNQTLTKNETTSTADQTQGNAL